VTDGTIPSARGAAAEPLWRPNAARAAASNLARFASSAGIPDTATIAGSALHRWSIDDPDTFWPAVWRFTGIVGEMGERVLEHAGRMPGARFFPGARLNAAENLLRWRGPEPAIVFRGEGGQRAVMSRDALAAASAAFAGALRAAGIVAGDRVAG
jgi:acetoacetyl-CoA synthetase